MSIVVHLQWRIQDFPQGDAPTPKIAIIFQIFAENYMKMKEFGPPGGTSLVPPLDLPMVILDQSVYSIMVWMCEPIKIQSDDVIVWLNQYCAQYIVNPWPKCV